MSFVRTAAVFALLPLILTGCVTKEIKSDHRELREILLGYTEDQIMENLIRTKECLPIVHFDFSHVTAAVYTKMTPTINGGRTFTRVGTRTPTRSTVVTDQTGASGTTQTVTSTIARTASTVGGTVETALSPITGGLTVENNNSLTVQVDPVLTNNEVYTAYDYFINKLQALEVVYQGNLPRASSGAREHPDRYPNEVHIGREWRGAYYYVPNRFRHDFSALHQGGGRAWRCEQTVLRPGG